MGEADSAMLVDDSWKTVDGSFAAVKLVRVNGDNTEMAMEYSTGIQRCTGRAAEQGDIRWRLKKVQAGEKIWRSAGSIALPNWGVAAKKEKLRCTPLSCCPAIGPLISSHRINSSSGSGCLVTCEPCSPFHVMLLQEFFNNSLQLLVIMKTDFQFSNLLGTVYGSGNLQFTLDGSSLISPVGNRVTIFDLVQDKSTTLPFTHRNPISRLALHPSGSLLLTVDSTGRAILSHIPRRIPIYHFSFRATVTALAFSPSGRYFAVATGRNVEIWHTPSSPDAGGDSGVEFAPFVLHRRYVGHFDDVTSLEWSKDSRFFVSAAKDLSARIWSLDPESGFVPTMLSGHRTAVIGAWFSKDQETVRTLQLRVFV
jgi:WD40 repeat protein